MISCQYFVLIIFLFCVISKIFAPVCELRTYIMTNSYPEQSFNLKIAVKMHDFLLLFFVPYILAKVSYTYRLISTSTNEQNFLSVEARPHTNVHLVTPYIIFCFCNPDLHPMTLIYEIA